jgi:hypothetical protein
VNCSENKDISSYSYGYVRNRKAFSAIASRGAAARNNWGARIAPPGTGRSKSV